MVVHCTSTRTLRCLQRGGGGHSGKITRRKRDSSGWWQWSPVDATIPPMILSLGVRKPPAWEKNLATGSATEMTPKGSTTTVLLNFLTHEAKSHLVCTTCEKMCVCCTPYLQTPLVSFDHFITDVVEAFRYVGTNMHCFTLIAIKKNIANLNFPNVFNPPWEKSNLKTRF